MTVFGWDASHYDGSLTLADLQRARAEGIDFFTHKLGEGLGGADPTQGTALAAARDAGVPVLGGYWFCHNDDDPTAEAQACVLTANQHESWWRSFPCWFWQPDCEEETGHGKPTVGWVRTFADELVRLTGRPAVVYGSHGQYGENLTGLDHPLWNASYPSSRQAPFRDLYPGDSYAGWVPYSGQIPLLCQYASSATIAGKTTCDANAFRGTVDQLLSILGGTVTGPATTPAQLVEAVWGLTAAPGDKVFDVIPNTSPNVADSPAHTPPGPNKNTSAGYSLGRTRALVEDLRVTVNRLQGDMATVLSQVQSNGGGISLLRQALGGGTVVLSDADRDDIAARVVDKIVARLTSPTPAP